MIEDVTDDLPTLVRTQIVSKTGHPIFWQTVGDNLIIVIRIVHFYVLLNWMLVLSELSSNPMTAFAPLLVEFFSLGKGFFVAGVGVDPESQPPPGIEGTNIVKYEQQTANN